MTNKQDIFKLVEEVEREKKKTSLEDIYHELDSIKDGDIKIEEKRDSGSFNSTPHKATSSPRVVSKPSLPQRLGDYDTRFACFKMLIEGVDYGKDNSEEYVAGHRNALEKYFKDAYNNQKDLYIVQAKVNDEINKYTSKNDLLSKGYYDGLYYVYLALKRSKELLVEKLADIIAKKVK